MNQLLLIAIGGAIGSVFRYLASTGIYSIFGKAFPYGTLTVNSLGSFLIGFIYIILLERVDADIGGQLRALLIVGFLGGFTTFSSFSLETMQLIENGDIVRGLLNCIISVVLCVGLAAFGALIARQL